MPNVLGIRRETKSPWERRSPVTPDLARHLVEDTDLELLVQPSARRVYKDKEYVRAGAVVAHDLSPADIILGVKEIPPDSFVEGKIYLFFSHVIKGQPHNMGMLATLMERGCTLIDYERVTSDDGQRLIFFGRFAGLAGMIDSLWAFGQRLRSEGHRTPFQDIGPAHTYPSLHAAKDAIQRVGHSIRLGDLPPELTPLVIGVAGYGNVARGVREILSNLPIHEVSPEELPLSDVEFFRHPVVTVTFKEQHMVTPRQREAGFDLQDYYDHPDRYRASFRRYLPSLGVLMNCNYWDERYPRLVTKDDLRILFGESERPALRVIGDLGCDVEGAVECTLKCTDPGDPVYVWDPATGTISGGVEGNGPVILAIDILPSELPLEASEEFSNALAGILPVLARTDFDVEFDRLQLPSELRRAVIVHRGELTPDYEYLRGHLAG